ncbi:DUF4040 domain-containing protein [Sedimentitalea sp. JM2-8]|uniref:DUF4040 domain-containing protein n=1 Tax=Sedimentitalea xiamensis TaxID=3050037 RepID=A0ABT7FCQ4_9RHOB|nr:hydrogenase subunit MbhD domain-containing protein [Sedimentitalea xiamensis]MDK3072897.1 DUF4040 domain-containing protein [Sedimentitalea xiamensis]
MLDIFIIVICAAILLGGVLAVVLSDVLMASVSAGAAGLFASLAFLLLGAPDVAMAEAAIGSGLGIFIFLYALKKAGYPGKSDR